MKMVEGKFLMVENLDMEEDSADLRTGAPFVQADLTVLVNVGVIDPGDELHLHKVMLHTFANCTKQKSAPIIKTNPLHNLNLWCRLGIVLREKELKFELASLKWGLSWSCHLLTRQKRVDKFRGIIQKKQR